MRALILSAVLLAVSNSPALAQDEPPPPSCQAPDTAGQCATVSQWRTAFFEPPIVRQTCVAQRVITTTQNFSGNPSQTESIEQVCTRSAPTSR